MFSNRPEHPYFRLKRDKTALVQYGGWLPSSREAYESLFDRLTNELSVRRANDTSTHTPAVMEFAKAITAPSDYEPKMIDLFNQMFVQAASQNDIKDFDSLLHMLDITVTKPPGFIIPHDSDGNPTGQPVGIPIYIIFDLLSNTAAAYDLFRRPAFNIAMKNLLNSWGAYLQTPDSNKTLTDSDGGWFSELGIRVLERNLGNLNFNSTYICPKPEQTNRGYVTWDQFFTREIQPDARPMHSSHDPVIDAGIIVSACESTVLHIEHNLQLHNQFWLKGRKYSLYDMLDRDVTFTKAFIGGTVYQAFLSIADYHRWRSPVAGTIAKVVVVPGTYYAALPDEGAGVNDPDFEPGSPHGAIIRSQAWLTQSATRALIYIESDNPKIGMVCFIAVGMGEVSTCALSVKAGDEVKKGAELGMFHFGGSTHALLFGPNANITFDENIVDPKTGEVKVNTHIKVLSALAQAS
ncbi:Phosphatidylserine decarboxylase [Mycena sanguinolenta]|uniref:Phosphatidylserine decarboxylase n=1 Tax=Mycena sanguinolenta TaxID=230812 RepID=A0A8H6YYZ1_9AGAR|nr:Phosphatidylserine decarboxylase [Mycena sanguinolenta]